MRHTITQKDGMGCGAACVAFAANITYDQTVKIMGEEKAKTAGYRLKELVNALSQYGAPYKSKHVNSTKKHEIYKEGTIVFIRRSKRYPYGHYLIRHKNMWMDPWINLTKDHNLANAQSGYRQRLPGQVQWVVLPQSGIV